MIKKQNKTFDTKEDEWIQQLKGKELASFVSRSAAFAIDFFFLFTVITLVMVFGAKLLSYFNLITLSENINLNFNLKNWYSLLLVVIYFGLFTYLGNGRTPGKRIMRIRVVSLLHERITLWHSIERALGYGASALEFGFGFLQYFIHPNKRTVHDRIAETIVISEKKKKVVSKLNIVEE